MIEENKKLKKEEVVVDEEAEVTIISDHSSNSNNNSESDGKVVEEATRTATKNENNHEATPTVEDNRNNNDNNNDANENNNENKEQQNEASLTNDQNEPQTLENQKQTDDSANCTDITSEDQLNKNRNQLDENKNNENHTSTNQENEIINEKKEQHKPTQTQILHTPYRSVGGKATKSFSIPMTIDHYNIPNQEKNINKTINYESDECKVDQKQELDKVVEEVNEVEEQMGVQNLKSNKHDNILEDSCAEKQKEEGQKQESQVEDKEVRVSNDQGNDLVIVDDDVENKTTKNNNKTIGRNDNEHHNDNSDATIAAVAGTTNNENNIIMESSSNTTEMVNTDDDNMKQYKIVEPNSVNDTTEKTSLLPPPSSQSTKPKGITLTFDNFVDLQTRLVLLPFKDDECVGASIASYMHSPMSDNDSHVDYDIHKESDGINGFILTGIPGVEGIDNSDEKDWTKEDYTNILSAIRESTTPIIIYFHEPDVWCTYQQSLIRTMVQASQTHGSNEEKEIILMTEEEEEAAAVKTNNCDVLSSKSDDSQSSLPPTSDIIICNSKSNDESINSLPSKSKKNKKKKNHINSDNNSNNSECIKKDEDKKLDQNNSTNNNNAFKGRFQRWGSQIAAEATKAVIAGKEIAREKVNERFLSPPQQQQAQKLERQTQEKVDIGTTHVVISTGSNEKYDGTNDELQIEEKKYEENRSDIKSSQPIITLDSCVQEPHGDDSDAKSKEQDKKICGLFLQTNFGQCLPLEELLYKPSSRKRNKRTVSHDDFHLRQSTLDLLKKSPPTISNTSVLVIRKSGIEACPRLGYCYQWYKTSKPESEIDKDDGQNDQVEWIVLDGATYAMFQPSATDVGFRVKCVVTIDSIDEESSTNTPTQAKNKVEVSCELPFIIESDCTLFNAAMKTFVPMNNGADGMKISSFGNVVGREEFQGLELRINLHMMQDDGLQGGFYMTFDANTDVSSLTSFYGISYFVYSHSPMLKIPR